MSGKSHAHVSWRRGWMGRLAVLLAVAVWAVGGASDAQAQTLYAATGAGDSDGGSDGSLVILDPMTGATLSTVGPINDASGANYGITGLAFDPISGMLFGSTSNNSPTAPGTLITIDPDTALVTVVGDFGFEGQTMADITFAPDGSLFGVLEASADDLFSIDPSNGASVNLGEANLSTYGSGLAADAAGTIFFTGLGDTYEDSGAPGLDNDDQGLLQTLSPIDGSPTPIAALSGGTDNFAAIAALDFDDDGTLFGIINDGNNFGGTGRFLATIDTITGEITILGPTANRLDGLAFAPADDMGGGGDPTIPEPASATLLALGGLALLRRRRPVRLAD